MPAISILLCSYNGVPRLQPTLRHLAMQQLRPDTKAELIVVDNASSDGTADFARTCWENLGQVFPISIIQENKPGTDHARRRALAAATCPYFVFVDDDNWLAENYLQQVLDFLESNPGYAAVGGQCSAVADEPLPAWFEKYQSGYAVGRPAVQSGDCTVRGLWTAGMGGRTAVFRKAITLPFLIPGRVGANTGSGEDGELCRRVRMLGTKLYYLDTLVMQHYMAPHRLQTAYRDALFADFEGPNRIAEHYEIALDVQASGKMRKALLLLRHLAAFLYSIIDGGSIRKRISSGYLFFLTRAEAWATADRKAVAQIADWLTQPKHPG